MKALQEPKELLAGLQKLHHTLSLVCELFKHKVEVKLIPEKLVIEVDGWITIDGYMRQVATIGNSVEKPCYQISTISLAPGVWRYADGSGQPDDVDILDDIASSNEMAIVDRVVALLAARQVEDILMAATTKALITDEEDAFKLSAEENSNGS